MLNFCDAKTACKILQGSTRSLIRYRQQNKLLEGIHWGRNPSWKVLYNSVLLNQLITCNGDINHPDHQKFMERYLSDRPENQPLKPGTKPGRKQGSMRGASRVAVLGWRVRHNFRRAFGHRGRWGLRSPPGSCQLPNHAKSKCVWCYTVSDNQSPILPMLVSSLVVQ